ncbi:MAG: hypothetical protein U1E47_09715 [Rivihabitans pingtungensis]
MYSAKVSAGQTSEAHVGLVEFQPQPWATSRSIGSSMVSISRHGVDGGVQAPPGGVGVAAQRRLHDAPQPPRQLAYRLGADMGIRQKQMALAESAHT